MKIIVAITTMIGLLTAAYMDGHGEHDCGIGWLVALLLYAYGIKKGIWP
jgi:hypothetical protein